MKVKEDKHTAMRIKDRLLLMLFSLAVGAGSVIAALIGFNWIDKSTSITFLSAVYHQYSFGIPWIAGSLLLLFISLRFLFFGVRKNGTAPSVDLHNEYGDVRISVETIANLSLKAASRFKGLKETKARIRIEESGLNINLKAGVDGEQSIPALSDEVQRGVKAYVEEITGLSVAHVSVDISNIVASGVRTRLD